MLKYYITSWYIKSMNKKNNSHNLAILWIVAGIIILMINSFDMSSPTIKNYAGFFIGVMFVLSGGYTLLKSSKRKSVAKQ